MKKLLLILLCLPLIGLSQKTYVPDDNFEQAIINLGADNILDDSVLTSSIDTITALFVFNNNISSLVGIEDFVSLQMLRCSGNQLSTLDLSNNISLVRLFCGGNQLSSLNLSNNSSLVVLRCGNNPLGSLDLSNNNLLAQLFCRNSILTDLNIKNGNNIALDSLFITNNPNLSCIEVNNINYFNNNFAIVNENVDSQHYFSNDCSSVSYDCTDSLEVTDVIIDNTNLTMNIAIYNGYNSYLSMPYVAFTIDANGDTIQQGNMNLFGAINLDTSWYNYSINSAINPSYPLTMYFVYVVSIGGSVTDTCI